MPDQNGRPLITESRLEEIEQRVRDASERGGRNWYKTDVPELLRAVRVERERAERLERIAESMVSALKYAGLYVTATNLENELAVLVEQEKQQQ